MRQVFWVAGPRRGPQRRRRRCGGTPKQPSALPLPSDSEIFKFRISESDCWAATQARTLTSHKIRFDAISLQTWQCKAQLNYLCGQVSIKTFGTKKIEELNRAKEMSKVLPAIPGKLGHFMLSSVAGRRILIDFLPLGYFCQSITWNPWDVAICHHQTIKNSIQSLQQLAGNVSKLQLICCMIYSLFSFDFQLIFGAVLFNQQSN